MFLAASGGSWPFLHVPYCFYVFLAVPGCSRLCLGATSAHPRRKLKTDDRYALCSWRFVASVHVLFVVLICASGKASKEELYVKVSFSVLVAVPCRIWLFLVVSGCFGLFLAAPGCSWLFPAVPGCSWLFLFVPGCFLDVPGSFVVSRRFPVSNCFWRI